MLRRPPLPTRIKKKKDQSRVIQYRLNLRAPTQAIACFLRDAAETGQAHRAAGPDLALGGYPEAYERCALRLAPEDCCKLAYFQSCYRNYCAAHPGLEKDHRIASYTAYTVGVLEQYGLAYECPSGTYPDSGTVFGVTKAPPPQQPERQPTGEQDREFLGEVVRGLLPLSAASSFLPPYLQVKTDVHPQSAECDDKHSEGLKYLETRLAGLTHSE